MVEVKVRVWKARFLSSELRRRRPFLVLSCCSLTFSPRFRPLDDWPFGIVATCTCCRKDDQRRSRRRPVVMRRTQAVDRNIVLRAHPSPSTLLSLMAERAFSRVYAERLILCTLVICTRDLS